MTSSVGTPVIGTYIVGQRLATQWAEDRRADALPPEVVDVQVTKHPVPLGREHPVEAPSWSEGVGGGGPDLGPAPRRAG